MAEDDKQGWASASDDAPEPPRRHERRSTLEASGYVPRGDAVRRGGSPIWPLLMVLLLLGAAAVGAVAWLKDRDAPAPVSETASDEPAPPTPAPEPTPAPAEDRPAEDRPAETPPPTVADAAAPAPVEPSAETTPPPAPAEPQAAAPLPARDEPAPAPAPQQTASLTPPAETPKPEAPAATTPPPAVAAATPEEPMLERPEPPAALVQAMAALAEAGSAEALAVVQEHAEAGWPEARRALGLAYAKGTGVAQDFEAALKLFKQAAEQDDADAQYYLGYAYLTGSGVKADQEEALAWFILAATRDQADALAERDRGLSALEPAARHRAFNRARNLGPELAAGWSRDPASGTAVWLPSWFRTGSYTLRLEAPAENGYAEGQGRLELKASVPGDSDRVFEGRFRRGHFFGKHEPEGELRFLRTDDFLYRLPDSPDEAYRGVAFWLRTEFGVDIAADPCYAAINRTHDLVAAVPDGFAVLDDEAATGAMNEAWRLFQERCPEAYAANVSVVPAAFGRGRDRFGHRIFAPRLASAQYYGRRGEQLSVGSFENQARRAHEEEQRKLEEARKRAAREEKRRRAAEAAPGRGSPDVRGLRLGMTLAELRAHFADEIVEWKPPWKPEKPLPPYSQFEQELQLADGARIAASFTSPVNGSVLFAFSYRQDLRNGPPPAALAADLVQKYGEPDDRGSGGIWWNYDLVSSHPKEVLGAFMKVNYRVDRKSGRVEYLNLVVNDAGFGSYDERAAYSAKVEAERRAFEAGKSEKPKF